ncbi:MAG: hypothetical protein ACLT8E_01315 [Akkermansia sp.]
MNYKVQKLNADKSPCTSGSPAYLDMVRAMSAPTASQHFRKGRLHGFRLRRGSHGGRLFPQMKVNAILPREPFKASGPSQGLLQAVGEGNRLTLEWYAPAR